MPHSRPRYCEKPFPPYSYVPGHFPHPVSDPTGHMHGEEHQPPPPLDPAAWQECEEYLYGVDLFNHGFYWEAHEAWESLWHAAGRQGRMGDFLKGLIKLAAAGVKAREGNPRGVERHANRAIELLCMHDESKSFCGIQLYTAIRVAETLVETAAEKYSAPQPDLLLQDWIALQVK